MVEVPDARESRREREFRHGQVRLVDQGAREVDATRAGHLHGRCAQVRPEQAAELPRPDAEPTREALHGAVVQRARGDQAERTRDDGRGPGPGGRAGRRLGAAAAAGAEAGGFGRGGAREPPDVLRLRRLHRTDRPAVDAGRDHAGEEAAVEAAVAAQHGLVAVCRVEGHGRAALISHSTHLCSAILPPLKRYITRPRLENTSSGAPRLASGGHRRRLNPG